jgi:hypothetical protein
MFCEDCGTQLGDGDQFCRKCGSGVGASRSVTAFAAPQKRSKAFWFLGLPLAILVCMWLLGTVLIDTGLDKKLTQESHTAKTRSTTYCALEMEDIYPLIKAYRDKDASALYGLIQRGKVLELQEGVEVQTFYTENGVARISVESGLHSGQRCFVPKAAIQ